MRQQRDLFMHIFRMIIASISLIGLCAYSTATPAKSDTSENPSGALIWDFEKKMKQPKQSSGSRLNQLKSFKKIKPRDDTGLITNIFNQGIPLKTRELSKVISHGISPQESHSSTLRIAQTRSLRPSTTSSAFALESTTPASTHAYKKTNIYNLDTGGVPPRQISHQLAKYSRSRSRPTLVENALPNRSPSYHYDQTLYR